MLSDNLLPGDVLVHHDHNWWDSIMRWGEWDGSPGEDYGATHIDVFTGGVFVAKMNPPVSSLYSILGIDQATVFALRLKPIKISGGLEILPGRDPAFAAALHAEITAHLGEPYDWSQIERFTGLGLLARLDPEAARNALLAADPLNVVKGHYGVCSEWTEARLENALKAAYGITADIASGGAAGQDGARPSDWTTFPMLSRVEGGDAHV